MLSLNLLPATEQYAVSAEETRRGIFLWTCAASCVLAAGSLLLLPTFLLSFHIERELARSLALEEEAGRSASDAETLAAMRDARRAADEIRAYAASPRSMGELMGQLLEPQEGIILSSFLIRSDGEVAISGQAAARGALLKFEETLRSSGKFLTVDFPLSDIVRERDIRFSARGTLRRHPAK